MANYASLFLVPQSIAVLYITFNVRVWWRFTINWHDVLSRNYLVQAKKYYLINQNDIVVKNNTHLVMGRSYIVYKSKEILINLAMIF